jgi:8-oxo-dGTP pyrophosphatase MutT (NUDIX family)
MTAEPAFRKLGERPIYDGYVINVVVGEFEAPDGQRLDRDIVHHPGAVSVVALDGDEVIFVKQFRAALNSYLLELPAGKRDVAGEPPEVTAGRELIEEVGMRAGNLVEIAQFYNSVGFSDEYSFVYLATDLEPVESSADGIEEEFMSIERHKLSDCPSLIDDHSITDGKTIIGVMRAIEYLNRGQRS